MTTRPEQRHTPMWQWLKAGVAFGLCMTLLGCIGATPLPKRTRTPEGTEVKDVDLSFLHPGHTTRAEVRGKLKLIDTGYEGDHFFLGRWASSTWGGWIISPGMPPGGLGGGGRVWKSGNLIVEFDDAGILKRFELFDDAKAVQHLVPVAADMHLQLESQLELKVMYWKIPVSSKVDAKIVLSKGTFDFEELGEVKKKLKFSLPANEVLRVETPVTILDPNPTYTSQRLRCARNLKKIGGPSGKDLNLEVTIPQLVILMSFVAQAARPPASGPKADSK